MEKLLKENAIYLLVVVIVVGAGIYYTGMIGQTMMNNTNQITAKKDELVTKQQRLQQIRDENKRKKEAQQQEEKKESKSNKVIYEVSGEQFSAEASFGIMFENILANMTNSGLRIRSIDYNYTPSDDPIVNASVPGYNACELSFVTVGSYAQLQTFLKNLAKENYLTGVYEIYLEPYDRDKSILISKFKIRLYTKTI